MVNKFYTFTLCAGLVLAPWSVMAQQEGASAPEEKMVAEEQKMEAELGIGQEQHQKMEALRKGFQGQQSAMGSELRDKKNALREMLEGEGALDKGKVAGLVSEIKSLQGKLLDNRVDQVFKIREVLTPEQYNKLKELRKKRQADKGMKDRGPGKRMHQRNADKDKK
ncbi:MAG: periplasmic heavy metal sensor [Candidatus Omnitrophica bacterium]|nr:periplasmic heavy metal sensor [Candidatus Omnitrophota bacterium]